MDKVKFATQLMARGIAGFIVFIVLTSPQGSMVDNANGIMMLLAAIWFSSVFDFG